MNDLIKIDFDEHSEQLVVSSREVAGNFEKRHDHVLRDIDNFRKDVPNFGEMFQKIELPDGYGRSQKVYLMNRDGFSLLSMGFTGQKALKWKLKYIEAFNVMEKELNSPERIMARALKMADAKILEFKNNIKMLENKVEQDKPKVIFADAVTTSKTSILVGELAKILKQNGHEMGQNRLFEWLRNNGYLIRRKGTDYNMPTQLSMELELFEIKETSITHSDGHISVNKTPKVTGKGQLYFVNKFNELAEMTCRKELRYE